MTQTTANQWSASKLLLVVAVVAIVAGAAIGATVGYAVRYEAPTTRTFLLFNNSLPFEEANWGGLSHDIFSPDRITVNKGDKVIIQYRNIEDVNEDHFFSMGQPYAFDAVIHSGQNENFPVAATMHGTQSITLHVNQTATISFTASWAGVFEYWCDKHLPTMTGYLVVLG